MINRPRKRFMRFRGLFVRNKKSSFLIDIKAVEILL